MKTFREKFSFVLTAVAYLLFHLRLGPTPVAIASGTLEQMMLTAPYAIGFTYITAVVFRKLTGSGWLPWDRLLRIFFTIGILFAFIFVLYEYGQQGPGAEINPEQEASVSQILRGDSLTEPLYSA